METLRSLVSIWVKKTLSIFITRGSSREAVYRKIYPAKVDRIFGGMPPANHRGSRIGGSHGTQVGRLGHSPKLISPVEFVRRSLKAIKTTLSTPKLFVKLHRVPSMRFVYPEQESQQAMRALHRVRESTVQDKVKQPIKCMLFCWNLALAFPRSCRY